MQTLSNIQGELFNTYDPTRVDIVWCFGALFLNRHVLWVSVQTCCRSRGTTTSISSVFFLTFCVYFWFV